MSEESSLALLSQENMMAWPKISIVTPSFNQAQFLETCIQSVLNQNYPSLEYFLIDGGSTDNSVEIIKRYQANLTYWISEPDEGQSDAINKGFELATGEIVAWLNSDDYYLPDALRQVARIYRSNSTAPFYFGNGLRVDEQGEPKRDYFPKGSLFFDRKALAYGLNYVLQPATFIRKKSLEKVGYLSTRLRYGMDTDLWLRLSTLGEPVPIQVPLAASREYTFTKTSTGSFSRIEELRQIAEKYTGAPVTPGIICYYLDTLYQVAQERPDLFPQKYQRDILHFWGKSSLLMSRSGARPDGFPLPLQESQSSFYQLKTAVKVYLRNFIKGRPTLFKKVKDWKRI